MEQMPTQNGPIGLFDSGYGGLTILEKIKKQMPQYDYLYLGDNARAPYGSRSFDVVYEFTRQSVRKLFDMGCPLVILACNTASAKALRSIQMKDLPMWDPENRVLGIIRPTVEQIGELTKTRHVGILGTEGTIQSKSYPIEISKLFPDITVTGKACPLFVPLVENSEYDSDGADYFVQKYLSELLEKDNQIDTIILGCTHYPLLLPKIRKFVPEKMKIVSQGEIVAKSLADYLKRHTEMESKLTKRGHCEFFTTESVEKFKKSASVFLHENSIDAMRISLE
ncbi:MAG TPA: glutamate racemase [Paludibacteraceae bacterium]|nr:glutamate racemase [Paludibacteraceae bacterium]HOU67285.1 glutamate racemase [Paludibacteraceae bacterium]HPH63286.1 glutamate racemase [Paludibacteraceae bacterium]HQF49382.1 glutamate racemase [Paludibacteraceae bacterium]HQJ88994.1 glutamate racemase [Paludibacteraceae bacterium]